MAQVKSGLMVLAFCWAHVRRDFVGVGKGWSELTPWALSWLRRVRQIYAVNRERLRHPFGSAKFQKQDALLRRAVEVMRIEAVGELSDPKLRQPCRKVLESLQEHWTGLIRFVDDPRIPMDNNASERAGRGPAVAQEELLRFGFPVEWPAGSGDVFAVRHAGPLENQSATVADVVLGELCGGWWKDARRHSAVLALESLGRTPRDLGRANHDSIYRRHFLMLTIIASPPPTHTTAATNSPPRRSTPAPEQIPALTG